MGGQAPGAKKIPTHPPKKRKKKKPPVTLGHKGLPRPKSNGKPYKRLKSRREGEGNDGQTKEFLGDWSDFPKPKGERTISEGEYGGKVNEESGHGP